MATMTASAIASKYYTSGKSQKDFSTTGDLYMGYDYNYSNSIVGCIRFTLAKPASEVTVKGIKTYGYNNTAKNKPLYYAVSQNLDDPAYTNKSDTEGALGSVYWTGIEQGRDVVLADVPAGVNYLYLWGLPGNHSRSRFFAKPETVSYEPVLGSSIASISSSVETLGSIVINMDRADGSHVHRATFKCGETELAVSEIFGASLSFPVPREWFSTYFDKTKLTVNVSVQTYEDAAGTIPTGDPATAELTVNADSGMRPVLLTGFAEAAPYNEGAAANISSYVKGYSRAEVSFDESAVDMSQTAGASIKGFSISAMGVSVSEGPYLSPILTGSTEIVCTVTDSRGRTASSTLSIAVLDYSKPTVTSLQAIRSGSDGERNEDGSYIAVTAETIYSALEGENALQMSARITAADGSFDQSYGIESGIKAALGGTLSPDISYTITVTAEDSLGNNGQSLVKLVTRKWALKFNEKGTAAAFGGAPEQEKMLELKDGWGLSIGGALTVGGKSLWDAVFPVGTVLVRFDHTSPASLFGGTWTRLSQRFLYGGAEDATIGATGGEASHALTVNEIPSHKHNLIWNNDESLIVSLSGSKASESTAAASQNGYRTSYTSGAVYADSTIAAPVGGGAAHNNMPPYVTVSVWRRTA